MLALFFDLELEIKQVVQDCVAFEDYCLLLLLFSSYLIVSVAICLRSY